MKNNNPNESNNKKNIKKVCFSMVIILFFILFQSCSTGDMDNVTIKMPPAQIVLVNNGSESYKDGTVTINDKYKSNFEVLNTKGTYTIGLLHFSDAEGNRFNLSMVVHKIYVRAVDSNGDDVSSFFEIN